MLLVPSQTLAELERAVRGRRAPAVRRRRGRRRHGAGGRSAYGALNGWILLQGSCRSRWHARASSRVCSPRRRAAARPSLALVSTSVLVTALVLMNFGSSMVQVFTFMALLSTTANLVAYLACSLALLALQRPR